MKKALVLIFGVALALSFSCKNKKQEGKTSGQGDQAGSGPAPLQNFEGSTIQPERYYKFKQEQLRMENEMTEKFLGLLKAAEKYDAELKAKLDEFEYETAGRTGELLQEYELLRTDEDRILRSPELKKALRAYLDQHPDIKKEVEKLEKINQKLNIDMNTEFTRLEATKTPEERPRQDNGQPQ